MFGTLYFSACICKTIDIQEKIFANLSHTRLRPANLKECTLYKIQENFVCHVVENLTVLEKFANLLGVPNLITKRKFRSFITGL